MEVGGKTRLPAAELQDKAADREGGGLGGCLSRATFFQRRRLNLEAPLEQEGHGGRRPEVLEESVQACDAHAGGSRGCGVL